MPQKDKIENHKTRPPQKRDGLVEKKEGTTTNVVID